MAESTENACRGCGKPLPMGIQLCENCIAKLAREIEVAQELQSSGHRKHRADIKIAVTSFVFTSAVLILVADRGLLSVEAMTFRLILLGIPCAAVLWKWYLLMYQADPDYGELWHTYWGAQLLVWIGLVSIMLFITPIMVLVSLMFSSIQ